MYSSNNSEWYKEASQTSNDAGASQRHTLQGKAGEAELRRVFDLLYNGEVGFNSGCCRHNVATPPQKKSRVLHCGAIWRHASTKPPALCNTLSLSISVGMLRPASSGEVFPPSDRSHG
jgi:hypothetical protein